MKKEHSLFVHFKEMEDVKTFQLLEILQLELPTLHSLEVVTGVVKAKTKWSTEITLLTLLEPLDLQVTATSLEMTLKNAMKFLTSLLT